jgi:enterochelin esterase-like enzyme
MSNVLPFLLWRGIHLRLCTTLLLLSFTASAAQKLPAPELIRMSKSKGPGFREALIASLGDGPIKKGAAFLGEGPDFIWAVEAPSTPTLFVDRAEVGPMMHLDGNLWYRTGQLKVGTSHAFYYMVNGERFGGNVNVPAYAPEAYEHPGVPRGKLTEKMVHTSKIYDGMLSDYWVYTPAQYDPAKPAALMVFQDGQGPANREKSSVQIVIDNLTYQKKIPPMVCVFISPGMKGTQKMRSIEYDTMNDAYPRFLRDEILPEVYKKYNVRKDCYSRGITGSSSGGICSFNAAFRQPDQFSRVLTWVGSYASIQWHPGEIDGGNVFPFLVRKSPKRNIRVWMQDGAEDLENDHGSWPLQNIQMANSLKMMGYDFHFSFGQGQHGGVQGGAELPQSLTWLWREYDPAKAEQIYEMEPAEKAKPLFRVSIYNRDH